MKNPDASPPAN